MTKPLQGTGAAEVRAAGRGGILLTGAKLYFLFLGLAQQVVLSWLLREGYGAVRGALSPASITYNPLVAGGVQGMSRAVSHASASPNSLRAAFAVHVGVAGITAGGFFLLAPILGQWLHSEYLVPAFRWLSLAILGYGLYAPLVGVLNGRRRFALQAGLDVLTATLRTIALFAGAWWWLERGNAAAVAGASACFAGITWIMVIVTAWCVGISSLGSSWSGFREHLRFVIPVILAQGMLNLLLQADTNTLRAFATRAAERVGQAPEAADAFVAAYNAGQLYGFLPYQLLMGISFVLFPMLARSHAANERQAVGHYARQGLRTSLIVTGAVVSVSSGLSESLIRLAFPGPFADLGADSMQLLSIGLGGFALFGMMTTVLNSVGRPWHGMVVTLISLLAVFFFNWLIVRPMPFHPSMLTATAAATSLGIGCGLLLAAREVHRATGALLAWTSLLRCGIATALCILAARQLPTLGRPLTVLASLAVASLYLLLLVVLRELQRADWFLIRNILRRGR